jgi:hypothetical protein
MYAQLDYSVEREKKEFLKDSTLLYKPFEKFKGDTVKHLEYWNDTIAYLSYNFIKRMPETYAGMTVEEFIDMLSLPVEIDEGAYAIGSSGDIQYCGYYTLKLYIVNEKQKNLIDNKQALLYISVGITPHISRERLKRTKSSNTLKDSVKDYTIRYAIIYKDFMDDYQRLMGIRQLYAKKRKGEAAKE